MIFIGANTTPASLPITLTNGTTADADQVMADFNALKNYVNSYSNIIHVTTGSASTQVLTYTATPLALAVGSAFMFIVGDGLTPTGPTTLNVNGTGAKNLTINRISLAGGEVSAGMVVFVVYDGTEYQIVGMSGTAGASSPSSNIAINPSMDIDQEHEGTSVSIPSATLTYVVDGWIVTTTSAATIVAQQVADAPPGFSNSVKLTVSTGAAVGAGDFMCLSQGFEGNNITDWAIGTSIAKTLILSFWVKSSIGTYTMCGSLQNVGGSRSYPFNVTIANAGTWEQKFVSIPLDKAGGWISIGAGAAAYLNFTAATGATHQSTVNTWGNGTIFGTSSCTNTLLSTDGATLNITGVDLFIGSAPRQFVRRTFAEELAICQRYYEKSYDVGVVPGATVAGGGGGITFAGGVNPPVGMTVVFKVNKRVAPTVVVYDNAGTPDKVSYNTAGWTDGGGQVVTTITEIGMFSELITSSPINNYDFIADARL